VTASDQLHQDGVERFCRFGDFVEN
jgi:hypothetical protein